MLRVIFTLDYEIHGNGEGSPHALMVEPTQRMLRLFDEYGAKLTIMADIAEILKFKEYKDHTGRDEYGYDAIVEQLQRALRTGHDVQLHIHSSYFDARHENGRWLQNWAEYNFAGLAYDRVNWMVGTGKRWLESVLQPVDPAYRCFAFRAANWSVSPSANVIRALVENGLTIDTSVFKYGRRQGLVSFDYSGVPSELLPWRANDADICLPDGSGQITEFPIYSENRWLGAFLTSHRVRRVLMTRAHRIQDHAPARTKAGPARKNPLGRFPSALRAIVQRHAWKADFNQCTGRQLIHALDRAEARYADHESDLPFVLIGHSKLFTRANEKSLIPFLRHVVAHPTRLGFGTFKDFALPVVCHSAASVS